MPRISLGLPEKEDVHIVHSIPFALPLTIVIDEFMIWVIEMSVKQGGEYMILVLVWVLVSVSVSIATKIDHARVGAVSLSLVEACL